MTNELTTINQDTLAEMKALTGENNGGGGFESYPVLEVNNKSEQKEIEIDGVKQIVTVAPEKLYTVTVRNDAGEYEKSAFVGTFDGIVMKVRYECQKKYVKDDPIAWWCTREFDSFFEDITVYEGGKTPIWSGSYQGFKSEYEDQYTLYLVLYVSVDGKIYKTKFKGGSRSNFWDYLKVIKKEGLALSGQKTVFAVEQKELPTGAKYNVAKYIKGLPYENQEEVLTGMRTLTMALESQKKKADAVVEENIEAEVGEVVDFESAN
jgi:hypothetical protein